MVKHSKQNLRPVSWQTWFLKRDGDMESQMVKWELARNNQIKEFMRRFPVRVDCFLVDLTHGMVVFTKIFGKLLEEKKRQRV